MSDKRLDPNLFPDLTGTRIAELDDVRHRMAALGYGPGEITDQRALSMAMQYLLDNVRPGERIVWTWRDGRQAGSAWEETQEEY